MEPKQNEVVKMHFIYYIYINIQEYKILLNYSYVKSHEKVGKSSTTKCGVAGSGNWK